MSCHGSRTTPLFQFDLNHVITYDDSNGPKVPPFHSAIELFVRIWKWEFEVALRPDGKRRRFARVKGYAVWLPFIGEISHHHDSFPIHQYGGDFSERTDSNRKEGYYS